MLSAFHRTIVSSSLVRVEEKDLSPGLKTGRFTGPIPQLQVSPIIVLIPTYKISLKQNDGKLSSESIESDSFYDMNLLN
jgi:hypothetical protein